jgi:hypothetical protein
MKNKRLLAGWDNSRKSVGWTCFIEPIAPLKRGNMQKKSPLEK